MLVHMYASGKEEEFRAKLLKRRRLAVGLLALGVLTLAVALILGASGWMPNEFAAGFYAGAGAGAVVASMMGLVYLNGLLKNEKKLRAKEILETDERVKLVNLKATSATAYVIFILLYVGILVLACFSQVLTGILLAAISLIMVVFVLARYYYNKVL